MIKFDNWRILNQGKVLARQYDNLTRELRVEGIIPEGWTWDLLVQAGKNLDIIRLNQGENSLSVMLTSEMLALAGYYVLQLRATQGEKVRHTNVLRVYVPESLSGDGHWPEVPSEFTQLEQRVRELSEEAGAAAEQAENAAEGVANNAKAAQEAAGQAQTAQDAAQGSAKQAGAAAAASAELAKTAADSAAAATQAAQSASDAVSSAQTSVQTATAQAQAAADAAQQARQAQQAVETAAGNAAQSAQGAGNSAGSAEASANAALQAVNRYPRINPDTMTWLVWDTAQGVFVDTGIVAEGKNGIEADGLWGVYVDEEGFLVVTYTGDDPPPLSISDDGYLVYTLNGQEIRVGKTVGPVGPVGPAGLGVPEATPEDADKIPIVAPDGTYKLGYQSGAIDDTKAQTDKTWSSLTIVDRLAPAFEASGPVVTCSPVEGYPLHVVSQIVPLQEGSGDPSPENVRPISGWTEATLTHNDTPITLPFGQTVYGGTLDWTTGVLTVGSIFLKLNTTYPIGLYQFQDKNGVFFSAPLLYGSSRIEGICSHEICTNQASIPNKSYIWLGVDNQIVYWIGVLDALGLSTVDEFKTWLNTQNVQIVYPMEEPVTIQLTPQEILALSGTNTLYTDTGDTTVSGRADPNAIIQQLASRIAALEGAATNL